MGHYFIFVFHSSHIHMKFLIGQFIRDSKCRQHGEMKKNYCVFRFRECRLIKYKIHKSFREKEFSQKDFYIQHFFFRHLNNKKKIFYFECFKYREVFYNKGHAG